MEPLILKKTNLTPYINYDPFTGKFEMAGYSRPEDVREFYKPIIQWVNDLQDEISEGKFNKKYSKSFTFIFKFTYFNSASTKFLSDMLFQIVKFNQMGVKFNVDWYYEEYDEDMREVGEDLSDMVSYPFNYYSFRSEQEL